MSGSKTGRQGATLISEKMDEDHPGVIREILHSSKMKIKITSVVVQALNLHCLIGY